MIYEYFINLEERGMFSADVRDEGGDTVFDISDDTGYPISELIDDGYMDHNRDIRGLREMLIDIGIMSSKDKLIPGNFTTYR